MFNGLSSLGEVSFLCFQIQRSIAAGQQISRLKLLIRLTIHVVLFQDMRAEYLLLWWKKRLRNYLHMLCKNLNELEMSCTFVSLEYELIDPCFVLKPPKISRPFSRQVKFTCFGEAFKTRFFCLHFANPGISFLFLKCMRRKSLIKSPILCVSSLNIEVYDLIQM